MEMLRTIIVALFFAGITVCSYYFLSSSPFPWESLSGGTVKQAENTANSPEQTSVSEASEETPTFAQDGPFAPAPTVSSEGEDFALPGLDELPSAAPVQAQNTVSAPAVPDLSSDLPSASLPAPPEISSELPADSAAPSLNSVSSQDSFSTEAAPPTMASVADAELPPLNDASLPPPLDAAPAPIAAQPGLQVGAEVTPALDSDTNLDLPGPTENTEISAPPALSLDSEPALSSGELDAPVEKGITNPLRGNAVAGPVIVPAASQKSVSASTGVDSAEVAAAEGVPPENAETAAVREYLKKAAEKIQNGEALEVLRELSKYYGNPHFSAEESAELINILVNAATQVIYSQKSFIDAPYTVQAGDTLEKIALTYQIPEDFIARVNGLNPQVPLQPGTQLKVVHGPFHAIVYLDRHEMLLTLNGLFAGRFWIGVGGELIQKDADFCFAQKIIQPGLSGNETLYEFLRTAGVPGSTESLRIHVASDPNTIGGNAPTGTIFMSQLDIESLGALLGPKSQLIMRCVSPKPVEEQQVAVDSVPAQVSQTQVSAPDQAVTQAPSLDTSMELPAVPSTPAPSIGTQPDLAVPASAPSPAAGELPLELPDSL